MILFEILRFLYFIIIGIIIGLLFDIFRSVRRSFKIPDIITYLQDILFLIITAILLLISIFIINNGEIRGFMFIGIFIGLIVYFSIISKYILKILTKILLFFKEKIVNPIYCFFVKKVDFSSHRKKINDFIRNKKDFFGKCRKK